MVLAWRMQKVSQLSQPFLWLLLPAVVALWCLDHAWSHQSGMPRWYLPVDVTGGALGDETPPWWSSDCTRSTHRHTGKETWSFGIFLFFFYFYLLSCQQGTGERIFRLSRKWGCNFLLWNISVAVLGKEGIAGEQVQPSLFILHSALLAVKAKFTLLMCVLGEWCPMQVPPLFHLNAKRSSSSRKWHVLIDLPSQSLKQKIPAAAQSQSSGWECVWPLAEAFTETLLKQGRVRLYPQLTNLHPKRHHCLQTLDSRLKGLLFGSWRAVQAQKPKVCFHLLTY